MSCRATRERRMNAEYQEDRDHETNEEMREVNSSSTRNTNSETESWKFLGIMSEDADCEEGKKYIR